MELPVACSLTDIELRERRETIIRNIAAKIAGGDELENGFAYFFPISTGTLVELAELISLERECCPFLTFTLGVEPGKDHVRMELTGPDGTKDFLSDLFHQS